MVQYIFWTAEILCLSVVSYSFLIVDPGTCGDSDSGSLCSYFTVNRFIITSYGRFILYTHILILASHGFHTLLTQLHKDPGSQRLVLPC